MVRKFKNKKTGEIAYYKDGVLKSGDCSIETGREPSSDIWEERKYELFSWVDEKGNIYENREPVASIVGDSSFYITSIKRLSDGEIFSVGDKVKKSGCENTGTISQIRMIDDRLYFSSKTFGWTKLENIIKSVLITVDGVALYEGDTYYCVNSSFNISKWVLYKNLIQENVKIFSSEIAAKNYLRDNEKKYSLNDMVSVVNHWAYIKNVTPEKILKYLENNGK